MLSCCCPREDEQGEYYDEVRSKMSSTTNTIMAKKKLRKAPVKKLVIHRYDMDAASASDLDVHVEWKTTPSTVDTGDARYSTRKAFGGGEEGDDDLSNNNHDQDRDADWGRVISDLTESSPSQQDQQQERSPSNRRINKIGMSTSGNFSDEQEAAAAAAVSAVIVDMMLVEDDTLTDIDLSFDEELLQKKPVQRPGTDSPLRSSPLPPMIPLRRPAADDPDEPIMSVSTHSSSDHGRSKRGNANNTRYDVVLVKCLDDDYDDDNELHFGDGDDKGGEKADPNGIIGMSVSGEHGIQQQARETSILDLEEGNIIVPTDDEKCHTMVDVALKRNPSEFFKDGYDHEAQDATGPAALMRDDSVQHKNDGNEDNKTQQEISNKSTATVRRRSDGARMGTTATATLFGPCARRSTWTEDDNKEKLVSRDQLVRHALSFNKRGSAIPNPRGRFAIQRRNSNHEHHVRMAPMTPSLFSPSDGDELSSLNFPQLWKLSRSFSDPQFTVNSPPMVPLQMAVEDHKAANEKNIEISLKDTLILSVPPQAEIVDDVPTPAGDDEADVPLLKEPPLISTALPNPPPPPPPPPTRPLPPPPSRWILGCASRLRSASTSPPRRYVNMGPDSDYVKAAISASRLPNPNHIKTSDGDYGDITPPPGPALSRGRSDPGVHTPPRLERSTGHCQSSISPKRRMMSPAREEKKTDEYDKDLSLSLSSPPKKKDGRAPRSCSHTETSDLNQAVAQRTTSASLSELSQNSQQHGHLPSAARDQSGVMQVGSQARSATRELNATLGVFLPSSTSSKQPKSGGDLLPPRPTSSSRRTLDHDEQAALLAAKKAQGLMESDSSSIVQPETASDAGGEGPAAVNALSDVSTDRPPSEITTHSVLDHTDTLSELPTDIDSNLKERYLMACRLLKDALFKNKHCDIAESDKSFLQKLLSAEREDRVPSRSELAAVETISSGIDNHEQVSVVNQGKGGGVVAKRQDLRSTCPASLQCPMELSLASEGRSDVTVATLGSDSTKNQGVLTTPLMEALHHFFPQHLSRHNFWLKFSSDEESSSQVVLSDILPRIRHSTFTIVAVESTKGDVFGAFCCSPWRPDNPSWYGGGEGQHARDSFLWRLKYSRQQAEGSSVVGSEENVLQVYLYTNHDNLVQLCTEQTLAVGGGDWDGSVRVCGGPCGEEEAVGIGLMVDGDLMGGETSSCSTFGNPRLVAVNTNNNNINNRQETNREFHIAKLEVWALTPYITLEEAERLESLAAILYQNQQQQQHQQQNDKSTTKAT